MSGSVDTFKGNGLTATVIPKDTGEHVVTVRIGRREGVLTIERDKREAKALARHIVGCTRVPGFREWLADGGACDLVEVF